MSSANNFSFIKTQQAYQTRFFQFPQVLLYGEKYATLSDSAKLGYMVLRDRLDYSLRNNWVDEENNVYFIFTNDQLQQLMHWSKGKVIRVKKELEAANLLYQRKMGFDPKKKKNLPNRLYLADLNITAQDVYVKQDINPENIPSALEPSGGSKMGLRQSKSESLQPQGSSKMGLRQKQASALEPSGGSKMRLYQDKTNIQDTIQIQEDTDEWDFTSKNYSQEQVEEQNQDLINHMKDFLRSSNADGLQLDFFLSKEAIERICSYARTPQVANQFISTILLAKNNAVKDFQKKCADWNIDSIGIGIVFDDVDSSELKDDVSLTIRRFFNRIRSYEYDDSKQIKNVRGYLYKTMYNMFYQNLDDQLEAREAEEHNGLKINSEKHDL
ncbi:replication initiator protein A [Lactobacillus sp. ESL0681]|uniref:replication initiator protein A n=1 Tax=Lactobacillus sp. ESL0681 TaxID=2983211 RepID=UPI0023F7E74C|nr:replication initiator protein A [Lactobacillus sp. ESL0681]WEV41295.1 replication initiator protein A [Lactobacillus sp. ESL0681]